MTKEQIITKIKESGLVAVIRAATPDEALKITRACIEGGVSAIELTFTVPGAENIIQALIKECSGGIIIGAGTVLDPETARIAILKGAEYIVSPSVNLDTIKLCNRYRVPVMPGVMTPTEAVTALEAGADILKIFPGGLFGPKVIKDFKGPLPQADFMPTGGVTVENAAEWIKAGAVALGAGSALTAGSYEDVVNRAKAFISAIKEARSKL
ncbi:MAG: bifunctional 2-keto-4-hydroxyglutarate aldolase/2-keto-3-deoxy-6-phosphogluconate aldolase [Christensenellales bacterium]|jgi:2-dehydro-3-deoxyphosphogluconate aldolase/(4S)-4-hydroxy-2-oxoglutarate aldolase